MRIVVLLLAVLSMNAQADDRPAEEILKSLLGALQTNDTPTANAGIETVFEYAAPANKAITGPLPRFIAMVSRHPYAELLNHQSAAIGPGAEQGDTQQFPIRLITQTGQLMGYVWTFERQADDRWMTASVVPVAIGDNFKGM